MEAGNIAPLNFLDMAEDVLIQILDELNIRQLVGVERVSKRFQYSSQRTVKLTKEEIDHSSLVRWKFINKDMYIDQFIKRYGTGLKKMSTNLVRPVYDFPETGYVCTKHGRI